MLHGSPIKAKMRLQLLTPDLRKIPPMDRTKTIIIGAVAIGGLILGGFLLMQNRRIEDLNIRIDTLDKIVAAVRASETVSLQCTDWLVGSTTGDFEDKDMSIPLALIVAESCGDRARKTARKGFDQIAASFRMGETYSKTRFLYAAKRLFRTYKKQARDFDKIYRKAKHAYDRNERMAPLTGQAVELLGYPVSKINDGLADLRVKHAAYLNESR